MDENSVATMIHTLYKYGRMTEHSEALFSTPTIYFSKPSTLNDPFECRPWLTFDGSRDQVIASSARLYERFSGRTPHEAKAQAVADYLEGRHRDPHALEALRREAEDAMGNVGLFCLSEVPDSILMWSHYALNHTGYCVEFEATDHTPMFGTAQKVTYSDAYPAIDFYNTPKEAQADLVFLTKYSGWAYEREWRIIDHDSGPGIREYPSGLMKSVIFGVRMTDESKATIRGWISKHHHSVRILQAQQNRQRFAIDLVEISENRPD